IAFVTNSGNPKPNIRFDKKDKQANNNKVKNEGISALKDLLTSGGTVSGIVICSFFFFFNLKKISVPSNEAIIANKSPFADVCSWLRTTVTCTASSLPSGVTSTTLGIIVINTATAITPGITPSSS